MYTDYLSPRTEAKFEPRSTTPALPDPDRLAAMIENASRMIAEATTDIERLRLHSEWESIRRVAKRLNRPRVVVEASIFMQHAERAIAQANPPTPPGRRGRGHKSGHGISVNFLKEIRRAHSGVPDAVFDALVKDARTSGTPMTRKAVAEAGGKVQAKPHVTNNSGEIEWLTPAPIIEAAREVMGAIDLDPASSDTARRLSRRSGTSRCARTAWSVPGRVACGSTLLTAPAW